MAGISPVLPLRLDSTDGISLTQTLKQATYQNLKNLLLTNPGERIDSNYGVGLKRFLFQQMLAETYEEMNAIIRRQVSLYVPNIQIVSLDITEPSDNSNKISLVVKYIIPALRTNEVFSLPVTT
jgi:phage baseplate assembly protein W